MTLFVALLLWQLGVAGKVSQAEVTRCENSLDAPAMLPAVSLAFSSYGFRSLLHPEPPKPKTDGLDGAFGVGSLQLLAVLQGPAQVGQLGNPALDGCISAGAHHSILSDQFVF